MKFLPGCKRVLISFFLPILLLSMKISAEAASTETGTLTVCLQNQKCKVELAVYRVADYCNGTFEILPEFEKTEKTETASDMQRETEAFVQQITVQGIAPEFQGYTKDGRLCFEKIPVGMYLVMQIPHAEDRLTVQDFLVSVPRREFVNSETGEENVLLYDVTAFPKEEETTSVPEEQSSPVETGDTSGGKIMVCGWLCLVSGAAIWVLNKYRLVK